MMDTDRIIAMLGEHGAKADRRRNYGDGVPSHTAMLMGEAIALIRKLSGSHGEPCQHCDDTGDVHGVDGEWRGVCSCPAGKRMVSNNFLRIAIEAYDDVFDGFPESREAAMRAALEAVYAVQDCPAQTHPTPATGSGGEAEGFLNVIDLIRTGKDGRKYDYAISRADTMVHVAPLFEHPAPAGGDAVTVDDAMVERACKRYAFREDGAVWPDAYSEHEVAAERVLMREFLLHALTAKPGKEGVK